MIYLIQKLWIDSMENEAGNAYGYKPYGYLEDLDDVRDFVSKGKLYTKDECWAFTTYMPEFTYTALLKIP